MEQIACVPAHVSYFLCCTRKSNAAFTLGAKVRYSLGTNVNTLGAGVRVQGLSWQVLFCFVLFCFFLGGGGVKFLCRDFLGFVRNPLDFFRGGGEGLIFVGIRASP